MYLVEPRVQDTDATPTAVTIAHALVRPIMYETQSQLHSLPLCLIDLSSESVKLHKGLKLAIVESTECPELIANIDQLEIISSDK